MKKIIATTLWFICISTVTSYALAVTHQICASELKSVVNKTINDLVANMQPNGTILVACQDEIIFEQGFGFADLLPETAAANDTQYLLASASKQFTAVALLKTLYDKNVQAGSSEKDIVNLQKHIEIDLNRPISYYLPKEHSIWAGSIPFWATEVTLHQLLTHSSGIANVTGLPGFTKFRDSPPNIQDLIEFFKNEKLEFKPGTKYSYSNSNYILLGEIIQQITGSSLDVYMQRILFDPINMHSTFMAVNGTVKDLKQADPRAKKLAGGYNFDVTMQHVILTEVKKYEPMQIPRGAGSIISTAPDVLKWNNALYSGKVIPIFLLKLMLTAYMPIEENISYGYGIKIVDSKNLGTYYYHAGAIPGFQSNITYIPALQLTTICLTNAKADRSKKHSVVQKLSNFKYINQSIIEMLENQASKAEIADLSR